MNNENILLIAEIGINHNNDLDKALELIEAVARSGAQIAKFQYYKAEFLYPRAAGDLAWKDDNNEYSYNIYEASRQFELKDDWIELLINKCDECGIEFMSSVFDKNGLDYLVSKGMKKIKLSSSNVTNIPLIEHAAKTGLPLFISTGGANLAEICDAVDAVIKYHSDLTLMQCNLSYPVDLYNVNMGVLETFKYAFPNISLGYSDHTREIFEATEQAIYLGATVIEKHVTFDRNAPGPDHFFAIEEDELGILVNKIEAAKKNKDSGIFTVNKKIYGNTAKTCLDYEKAARRFGYTVIFANRDIGKGEIITKDDLLVLRRANKEEGLQPKYMMLFEDNIVMASKKIRANSPININMLNIN